MEIVTKYSSIVETIYRLKESEIRDILIESIKCSGNISDGGGWLFTWRQSQMRGALIIELKRSDLISALLSSAPAVTSTSGAAPSVEKAVK